MFYNKIISCIIVLLLTCLFLNAEDAVTVGQGEFLSLYNQTAKMLDDNQAVNMEYLIKNVRPLLDKSLDKSISTGQIWNNNLENLYVPSFSSFLTPQVGKHKNPFFAYALSYFLNNERFQKGELSLKHETCTRLVNMLQQEEYAYFHSFILRMLFSHFHNVAYYNEDSKKMTRDIISTNNIDTIPKIILLPILFKSDSINTTTIRFLQKNANSCIGYNRKNIIPWLSLLYIAQVEKNKYLNKLCAIVKQTDNSNNGIMNATYMFPTLTLVQNPEVVELLKEYLKDDVIIDQGDDIMYRYTGLSYLAAMSLYTMIDGFPEFSRYEFNQKERQKCLDWMKKNPEYKFREIDYWSNDPIISRMRYLIFEID